MKKFLLLLLTALLAFSFIACDNPPNAIEPSEPQEEEIDFHALLSGLWLPSECFSYPIESMSVSDDFPKWGYTFTIRLSEKKMALYKYEDSTFYGENADLKRCQDELGKSSGTIFVDKVDGKKGDKEGVYEGTIEGKKGDTPVTFAFVYDETGADKRLTIEVKEGNTIFYCGESIKVYNLRMNK